MRPRVTRFGLTALVVASAVALVLWYALRWADGQLRRELEVHARVGAASLNPRELALLRGARSDTLLPAYWRLKEVLVRMGQAMPLCRFIYVMGRTPDGTVTFLVDSALPGSSEESLPGDPYPEASPLLRQIFTNRRPATEGPLRDAWGTWVSAFVPVEVPSGAHPVVVFGVDVDAGDWSWRRASRAAFPGILVVLGGGMALLGLRLHRVNRRIRERERTLGAVFGGSPTGLGLARGRRVLEVNERLCAMTGLSREQILRGGMGVLFPSEEVLRAVERELEAQVRSRGWGTVETRAVKRDGGYADVVVSWAPLDPHDPSSGVAFAVWDISERTRAEQALREEQRFTQLLFDTTPAFIVAISPEGRTLSMNRAMQEALGYNPDEVRGTDYLTTFVPEEDRAALAEVFSRIVAERAPTLNVNQVVGKDGRRFTVEWRGRPVTDDEGRVLFFIGVGIDITERLRAEAERAELQERYLQAQKMEAVGRLAGGIAHDFNNMLQVVLGHVEMMLGRVGDEGLRRDLEEVRRVAVRSAELTRKLLGYARRQVVVRREVELDEVVGGMMGMLRRLVGEDVELRWVAGGGRVYVDPVQVEQVVVNLVVNARDAGAREVEVETGEEGGWVRMVVRDDGSGMSEEVRAHLFEPFYTTKGEEGTGLGLATVKGIVEQNGGRVEVESEEGVGTEVRVWWPRYEGVGGGGGEEVGGVVGEGGGEVVMVVEDEGELRRLVSRMVSGLGYRVVEVGEVGEVGRLAVESGVDVVVTDVVMPGRSGREVVEEVRRVVGEVGVVYMSGYPGEEVVRRGVGEGEVYVQKPFTVEELGKKIKEALQMRRRRA